MDRILGLAVLLCSLATLGHADNSVVLARDHPQAVVFLQMARRGLLDYRAQHGKFPVRLAELSSAGYVAYDFPADWQPAYELHGEQAIVRNLLRPGYFLGRASEQDKVTVTAPGQGLYVEETHKPAGQDVTLRRWNFPGAQWLNAGHSWSETEEALRLERIYTHCNWMTAEYNWAFNAMPQSLNDLETYLGTSRNDIAWSKVRLVGSVAETASEAGTVFVGWDSSSWVVAVNCGPERLIRRWTVGQDGHYVPDPPGVAY